MLKIRRLYSEGSYETPFDKNIDGFEEKWWSQLVFDAMSFLEMNSTVLLTRQKKK